MESATIGLNAEGKLTISLTIKAGRGLSTDAWVFVLERGESVVNTTASCEGTPGTLYKAYNGQRFNSYSYYSLEDLTRTRADGRDEEIREWSLYIEEEANRLIVCLVTLPADDLFPEKRTYPGTFTKDVERDGVIPYQVNFQPNYSISMNYRNYHIVYENESNSKGSESFRFDYRTARGSPIDDLELRENRRWYYAFFPPVRIHSPEVTVQVSSLGATSFTVLADNLNEFADSKLFWVLLPYPASAPAPEASTALLEQLNSGSPVAWSSLSGADIPSKSGNTNGQVAISISTGIEADSRYVFYAFLKTGGYTSLVGKSGTITTLE